MRKELVRTSRAAYEVQELGIETNECVLAKSLAYELQSIDYVHENQLKVLFLLYFHFFVCRCDLQYNKRKFYEVQPLTTVCCENQARSITHCTDSMKNILHLKQLALKNHCALIS
jgi:hypothetical protein